jgi:hypothetical protein
MNKEMIAVLTLAAGESRTCTVKNYITEGSDFNPV